jgi:proteic killer suppression protein
MIVHFKHRGLELFFTKGSFRGIPAQFTLRLERLLDRLEAATFPKDMDLPGYKFHELKGRRKGIYAVTVSGNWRLTFEFNRDDVVNVDLEDYH